MFFDFVDGKTRSVLEALMKRAYNYFDFAALIAERACIGKAPQDLPFIAVLHSFKLWNMDSLNKLSKKYGTNPLIRPFLLYVKSGLGLEVDWQEVLDSTKVVLDSHPAPWIALQLQLLNYSVAIGSHRAPLKSYTLAAIGNLIHTNEELACFSPFYWIYHAALWDRLEDQDKKWALTEKAIEIAKDYDDRYSIGYGYRTLASLSFSSDVEQTKHYLKSADAIFEDLGHKLGLAENYDSMSGVYQITGYFDKALECLFESMRIKEALGVDNWLTPTNVAWIYNMIGDYETALEWSQYALMTICMCDNLLGYPHLVRARALINIGRIKDAVNHLDIALRYALKEGDERLMRLYDVTQTLIQRVEGDPSSAMPNLEEHIATDYPTLNIFDIDEYLLLLAETELFSFNLDDENQHSEHSGPWMELMEERAREKEAPGFLGLVLLLKARLRLKQNRIESARYLIYEVQQLGEIYNMDTLYNRATNLNEIVNMLES